MWDHSHHLSHSHGVEYDDQWMRISNWIVTLVGFGEDGGDGP